MRTKYIIQKRIINTDFLLSKTKKANKLEIKEDQESAIVEDKIAGRPKNDMILYKIPLKDVIETAIIDLKKYRKIDKLIQIIFIEDKQRLRIMRLNIQDDKIKDLEEKIRKLSVKNSNLKLMLYKC